MKTRDFFKLIMGLLTTVFLSVAVSEVTPYSPVDVLQVAVVTGLVIASVKFYFIMQNPDHLHEVKGLTLDVATEFWDTMLAKNLFRKYEWLGRAKNRDGNVLASKVVHIPQAGAVPNVVRNRQQYPIPMVKRSDSDITYVIDELSSDTTLVNDAEKWELSYDKIPDILNDHLNQIGKRAAQNALYRWLGKNSGMLDLIAANIIRTTGANTGHLMTGATGTRNRLTVADFLAGHTIIKETTKQDSNSGRRAAIMTLQSYGELKADAALDTFDKREMVGAVIKNGELVKLADYDIIVTDVLPRFNNAGTPIAKDSLDVSVVNANTDNDVTLLVDFDLVHIARSETKMFYEANNVPNQGDIMNALSRMGASRERGDQAGIVAIVQQ